MKNICQLMIMAAFVFGSVQVKAQTSLESSLNTIEAFNSIIPNGVYHGGTESGEACLLTVRAFIPGELVISITNLTTGRSVPYFLDQNTAYVANPETKSFSQTIKYFLDEATNAYTSNTIKTDESDGGSIYVEVAKSVVFDSSTSIEKLNCFVGN